MDSSSVLTWMIAICGIFMGLIIFLKPLKYIGRFIIQAVFGIVFGAVFNFVLAPVGVSIGLNYLTAFITGLLGIPGFASLYLLSYLL